MNETKLNIVKRVLGVHHWTLKEDKNKFPKGVFIFDEDGKLMAEYVEDGGILLIRKGLVRFIFRFFNLNFFDDGLKLIKNAAANDIIGANIFNIRLADNIVGISKVEKHFNKQKQNK